MALNLNPCESNPTNSFASKFDTHIQIQNFKVQNQIEQNSTNFNNDSYRLGCDQHVSDTPIYKFDRLILNIITQYFAQIFCSPIEVTLQKMVIAHLV